MSKIELLRENLGTLFRTEGARCFWSQNEIKRLLKGLDYGRLYHALCADAEPVYTYFAVGSACNAYQYHATKLFPENAVLIWSSEEETVDNGGGSAFYFHELWLRDDMTIAATSCFRMVDAVAGYMSEYRENKGGEWPAHIAPINILELLRHLAEKYHTGKSAHIPAPVVIYEP